MSKYEINSISGVKIGDEFKFETHNGKFMIKKVDGKYFLSKYTEKSWGGGYSLVGKFDDSLDAYKIAVK